MATSGIKKCPKCSAKAYEHAVICPGCGTELDAAAPGKSYVRLLLMILFAVIIFAAGNNIAESPSRSRSSGEPFREVTISRDNNDFKESLARGAGENVAESAAVPARSAAGTAIESGLIGRSAAFKDKGIPGPDGKAAGGAAVQSSAAAGAAGDSGGVNKPRNAWNINSDKAKKDDLIVRLKKEGGREFFSMGVDDIGYQDDVLRIYVDLRFNNLSGVQQEQLIGILADEWLNTLRLESVRVEILQYSTNKKLDEWIMRK